MFFALLYKIHYGYKLFKRCGALKNVYFNTSIIAHEKRKNNKVNEKIIRCEKILKNIAFFVKFY